LTPQSGCLGYLLRNALGEVNIKPYSKKKEREGYQGNTSSWKTGKCEDKMMGTQTQNHVFQPHWNI
jgi:hypothetical protein